MRSNPGREFRDEEREWILNDRFEGAVCPCGERRAACLVNTRPIRCYRCDRVSRGLPPVERHHIAGRHNMSMTVTVDANIHRLLSYRQLSWSKSMLRNPDRCPLTALLAFAMGLIDLLVLILAQVGRL